MKKVIVSLFAAFVVATTTGCANFEQRAYEALVAYNEYNESISTGYTAPTYEPTYTDYEAEKRQMEYRLMELERDIDTLERGY